MTDSDRTDAPDARDDQIGPRRATIASDVDAPETVAAAIAPDDTDEIHTRVEDGRVVTTIERETTGGLEATIDDSVVALDVAITTAAHAASAGTDIGTSNEEHVDRRPTDDTDEQPTDRHDTHSP